MNYLPFEEQRKIDFTSWYTRRTKYTTIPSELLTLLTDSPLSWKISHFALTYELTSYLAKQKFISQKQWVQTLKMYESWYKKAPQHINDHVENLQFFRIDTQKKSLYTTTVLSKASSVHDLLYEISFMLLFICSPIIIAKMGTPIPLWVFDAPYFSIQTLAQYCNVKLPHTSILPPTYRKALKKIYTSVSTRDSLAETLNSNKKAKKYLRILQKRLGIYTHKKPPFVKI